MFLLVPPQKIFAVLSRYLLLIARGVGIRLDYASDGTGHLAGWVVKNE